MLRYVVYRHFARHETANIRVAGISLPWLFHEVLIEIQLVKAISERFDVLTYKEILGYIRTIFAGHLHLRIKP